MKILPYDSRWPPEWTGQRRSGILLFGGVFLGLIALGAVSQLSRGPFIFAVVAVYFGHLAAMSLHSYGGGRRRTDTTGVQETAEGLVFRYAAAPTYLVGAFSVLTIVALAGLSIAAAAQATVEGYVICVAVAVLAVLMLVFLVVFLRLAPGRVVIGPDGFHHRGLTFTHFVPWEAVSDVAALWAGSPVVFVHTIGSPRTLTHNYLGRDTAGPRTLSPFDTVSGRWLAADPGLLLRALAYYIGHPADRSELAAGTALRRVTAL
ncbi:hypothetical protein OWR29_00215 [Actinoplanes sp. Pm04-4]|uniref:PH domain-containing protein n=1 Tax=Paractinoplanes pyxinae TaxID=2997416 RepID=A0ABT4AQ77_9ACTN|nr:hypothetical protein [Actinoplanes pyxinae]MCY1136402.1 hypothetical protein [Actinoplanes pyxinae]